MDKPSSADLAEIVIKNVAECIYCVSCSLLAKEYISLMAHREQEEKEEKAKKNNK